MPSEVLPSEPLVLAFDTSAAHCAAALLSGDRVLVQRAEPMTRGQAERLMPLLAEVLAEAGIAWRDLTLLAVGTGPGNFTGVRIAVAAARGLALGLDIPARGVSLFETTRVLANWAQVAVPAPRDQVYFLDPDKMRSAILTERAACGAVALSSEFDAAAHVQAMARLARDQSPSGDPIPPPAPLYIRAADAAPASDPPPVILDA